MFFFVKHLPKHIIFSILLMLTFTWYEIPSIHTQFWCIIDKGG